MNLLKEQLNVPFSFMRTQINEALSHRFRFHREALWLLPEHGPLGLQNDELLLKVKNVVDGFLSFELVDDVLVRGGVFVGSVVLLVLLQILVLLCLFGGISPAWLGVSLLEEDPMSGSWSLEVTMKRVRKGGVCGLKNIPTTSHSSIPVATASAIVDLSRHS